MRTELDNAETHRDARAPSLFAHPDDLFRLLVQSVLDYAIFALDPDGHVISWNAGAERLKGYSAAEIMGKHFSCFYPVEDRHKCATELAQARAHGSVEDEGWRVRNNGSLFWASVVITALRDERGRLVGYAKVTRDLTERRHAEAAVLAEREARARTEAVDSERRLLDAIVSGVDHGLTLQDESGRLLFANATAARTMGFSSAEALLAAPLAEVVQHFELFREDGRPLPAEELPGRAVLRGEPSTEVLVCYRLRETHESKWSLVHAVPVKDASGKATRVINIFRDVTDARREEGQRRFLLEAVREFNSSLDYEATLANVARQMVPSLADWCAIDILEGDTLKRLAVTHVDPEKVAFVQELERRYPAEQGAPGTPLYVLRTGKPYLLESIPVDLLRARARSVEHLALIEGLQLTSFLAIPIIGNGRPFGVLTLAMAESGRKYSQRDLGFATVLADRAAASIMNARLFHTTEQALLREGRGRQEAERVARFSEMFMGILGHDLRTPLNAIAMGAQVVLDQAETGPQQRVADRIRSSALRMGRMIDQLTDFTRVRIGAGFQMQPSRVHAGELVRQVLDETDAAHKCELQYECEGDLVGHWDSDRLSQAFSNLLSNAAQHRDGGPVLVGLDGSAPATLRIEIRNHGEVPADLLPHIFDPFRGSRIQRPGGRGLGLGLYIAREIVLAHGGTMTVNTIEGSTSFQIELPRSIPIRAQARELHDSAP